MGVDDTISPSSMKPRATVKLDDLTLAFAWVSATPDGDNAAFVSRVTGQVHWTSASGELDDEPPDDIDDASVYAAVPSQHDLDLGRSLALAFAEERLSASFDSVAGFFRRRGAYGKFKDLLDRQGQLQAWFEYEAAATEAALRAWASQEGFAVTDETRPAT